jgi:hypothetical protein
MLMNKKMRIIALAILMFWGAGFVFFASPALAQIDAGLNPVAQTTNLGTTDIRVIVSNIIYVALSLVGVVLLVIIAYAGFLWMTAGGNEDQVEKAKQWIKNSVIGLIIVLSSYAITYFIITRLMGVRDSTGVGGPSFEQGIISGLGDWGGSALGEGTIQAVFPTPGATEIPRNTKVIITFKTAVDASTIISNGTTDSRGVLIGQLNAANVRLLMTKDVSGGAFQTSSERLVTDVRASTADQRTFVLTPAQYLGSPNEKVSYTAALGAGIRLASGGAAFSGAMASGYHWEFETNTTVDLTPPYVVSVVPSAGSTVPRNAVIEITFNEAVDPTSATGLIPPFINVAPRAAAGPVNGSWEPANQYKTIGFRTNVKGGTNSCGDDVYVLPGGTTITVSAFAATVGSAPPAAAFFPADGVTDIAGNSLDANRNGRADGPGAAPDRDNFVWSFSTTEAMDLTPPRLTLLEPSAETGGVDLSLPVAMTFSKPMSLTTLDNRNLIFESRPKTPLWYFGAGENLRADGTPVASPNDTVARTKAQIIHSRLSPTVGKCSDGVRSGENCAVNADCPGAVCSLLNFYYYPKAASGVTDIYQNCFLPACGSDPDYRYCCSQADGTEISCQKECIINDQSGRLFCPQ